MLRDTDLSEQSLQSDFQNKTCGCVRLYGKPCSSIVDWNSLIDYRTHCLETSHNELDMIIKVFHHRRSGEMTESRKHPSKEREKPRQEYFFSWRQVCRETFAFAHGVNRKKIDAIARSLDSDGLIPRTHGNTGKSPKHALTLHDVENIKQFLNCYGNKFGLPLPGRLPNFRDSKVVLLPSDKTKADIHQDYMKARSPASRLAGAFRSAASRLVLTQKSPASRLAADLKVSCRPASVTYQITHFIDIHTCTAVLKK